MMREGRQDRATSGGDYTSEHGLRENPSSKPTLEQLGIDKNLAHRARHSAAITVLASTVTKQVQPMPTSNGAIAVDSSAAGAIVVGFGASLRRVCGGSRSARQEARCPDPIDTT
jgi:hypothetical protein